MCGIQLTRTTAHHPAANGLVERFHRTLKAAIMCHEDQQWTEALPLVLGIRTAYKEDLQASVAELVYGEPPRIPGELLTPTAEPVDPAHLITELRQHMARLRPIPAARHTSPSTFVHSDLERCTHVFLRQDTTRRVLEPPYSGPYRMLSRRVKTLQLLVRGRPTRCQRTGSSRSTPSTGPTTGTTSTRQSQHPRPQHHQPRRHSPTQELHAPAVIHFPARFNI
jgi:cleavage and polyadenylation specificity factor subunit 1